MSDWNDFLDHIRDAYRTGYSPPSAEDYYNNAKDPEESHLLWENAVKIFTQMTINGDPAARKAARLVKFVQDHPRVSWWYG